MRKRVSLGESGANHSGGQVAKIGVECLKLVTAGLNPDLQPRLAVNPGGQWCHGASRSDRFSISLN